MPHPDCGGSPFLQASNTLARIVFFQRRDAEKQELTHEKQPKNSLLNPGCSSLA